MTFTGFIGTVVGFPLRLIISVSVALRIHPNLLTLVGVLINIAAAWALALGHFVAAGAIMTLANIFDYIDGKVATALKLSSDFGGFWDSVMDRFSDISLFIGLIYLYSQRGRTDYVMVTALAMMFAILTSYTRARAESLVDKCKVGFMERPERIVLFMIGAFTNRMAGVLWVILVLSVSTVFARIYFTWRALQASAGMRVRFEPERDLPMPFRAFWHSFYWTFERATWQYDVMVVLILAFVWLTPPDWLADPMAHGTGPIGFLLRSVFQEF
ncbi:MAG: pgsA1 [Acidobacteria bacterium]|jgi:CDP-diacylglycerol--glycerol-3-phosphate 3-phosphatidyltransferase|nr:pgsA1 [Acidobacteriota bacterium]